MNQYPGVSIPANRQWLSVPDHMVCHSKTTIDEQQQYCPVSNLELGSTDMHTYNTD